MNASFQINASVIVQIYQASIYANALGEPLATLTRQMVARNHMKRQVTIRDRPFLEEWYQTLLVSINKPCEIQDY